MVKREASLVVADNVATANDVLDELRRLDKALDTHGMEQFRLFNHAYRIVTEHIHQAMSEGYFNNPVFIDEFIVTFVGYYFRALNDTADGTLDKSSPWAAMNEYATIKSAPVFLSLLIGANAHINYDLPQALKGLILKRGDQHLLDDVTKINKILMISGKEIASSFDETNKLYDFLKRRLRFTYYRPAMYTIFYWRIVAWRNYKRLLRDEAAMSRISRRSARIARQLLSAARILSMS